LYLIIVSSNNQPRGTRNRFLKTTSDWIWSYVIRVLQAININVLSTYILHRRLAHLNVVQTDVILYSLQIQPLSNSRGRGFYLRLEPQLFLAYLFSKDKNIFYHAQITNQRKTFFLYHNNACTY